MKRSNASTATVDVVDTGKIHDDPSYAGSVLNGEAQEIFQKGHVGKIERGVDSQDEDVRIGGRIGIPFDVAESVFLGDVTQLCDVWA